MKYLVNAAKGKKLQKVTFPGTYRQRQRRRQVFQLRLQNFSIREMAKKLECSVNAIILDLENIEWALQQRIDPNEATQILNEALNELVGIKSIALGALEKATGNVRVGLLNVALRSIEISTSLLQDGGILPRATQRHQHEGADGGPIPVTLVQPRVRLVLLTSEESERAMKKMMETSASASMPVPDPLANRANGNKEGACAT